MPQNWNSPAGTNESISTVVATMLPEMSEALRSLFSGPTEPTNTVAYMLWADTTDAVLKMRNAANAAWVIVGPLGQSMARQTVPVFFGDLNASTTRYLLAMPWKGNVTGVRFLSHSATAASSSGVTEWSFMLTNVTDGVDLFSAAPGTGTEVGGVGGNVEVAADTPYVLAPDQNALIDAGDVLEFAFTKTGSPAQLDRVLVQLDIDFHGIANP